MQPIIAFLVLIAIASTSDNTTPDLDVAELCYEVNFGRMTYEHAQDLLDADAIASGSYEIQIEELCNP
jgi:hypothetical protein